MTNPYAAPDAVLSDDVSINEETYEPKVFALHGRIGRMRYLAYTYCLIFPIAILVGMIGGALSAATHNKSMTGLTTALIYIPVFAISLVMAKRRLNDFDTTGWAALLLLIPFVNGIFGLVLMFKGGTDGPNSYGQMPAKNSTLVVIGAFLLPIIAVVGILAAVAIPAYHGYTVRAKAAQAAHSFPAPASRGQ